MVPSHRTVSVLLYKHCSSWLSTFFSSISIITNYSNTTISESNIIPYHNSFIFSSQLITSNLHSIPVVFHQFFTFIATDDRALYFSLMLIWKGSAVKEETTWPTWLYHQHNQSIHVTDVMAVAPLSVSLPQTISMAPNHVFQIVLN